MSDRDELATLLEETDHCDGGPYRDDFLREADAILASEWLARDRARVAAEALEAFRPRCPLHDMSDCSPLLNGCNYPKRTRRDLLEKAAYFLASHAEGAASR